MIGKLLISVFVSPSKGFSAIKKSEVKVSKLFFNILLPFILIVAALAFVGVFFVQKMPIEEALRYSAFSFLMWLTAIPLSSWAINSLVSSFKGEKHFGHIFYIIAISVSFLLVFSGLSYLFPDRKHVLMGLSFVGFFYYYIGLLELTSIPRERLTGFLLISLLVFALIVFISQIFWGLAFRIPIQL